MMPDLPGQGMVCVLPCGSPCKGRSMVKTPVQTSKIHPTFLRPMKRDPDAVQHVNQTRGRLTHPLDGGLMGQKITPPYCFLKMPLRRIPFLFGVHGRVDPFLQGNRSGSMERKGRQKGNVASQFGDPQARHQARNPPPYHYGSRP